MELLVWQGQALSVPRFMTCTRARTAEGVGLSAASGCCHSHKTPGVRSLLAGPFEWLAAGARSGVEASEMLRRTAWRRARPGRPARYDFIRCVGAPPSTHRHTSWHAAAFLAHMLGCASPSHPPFHAPAHGAQRSCARSTYSASSQACLSTRLCVVLHPLSYRMAPCQVSQGPHGSSCARARSCPSSHGRH